MKRVDILIIDFIVCEKTFGSRWFVWLISKMISSVSWTTTGLQTLGMVYELVAKSPWLHIATFLLDLQWCLSKLCTKEWKVFFNFSRFIGRFMVSPTSLWVPKSLLLFTGEMWQWDGTARICVFNRIFQIKGLLKIVCYYFLTKSSAFRRFKGYDSVNHIVFDIVFLMNTFIR